MAKKANINIRIDPEVKARSEQLFARFGITITDAWTVSYPYFNPRETIEYKGVL